MPYDLSDVTFMIPLKIDSPDRINNLNIVTTYLRHNFNTKIIIAEQDGTPKVPDILCKTLYDTYIHYKCAETHFHKTRLVNAMAKHAQTPIVAMYDSDILFTPNQYLTAVNKLRADEVDFIYPFNGKVINIKRNFIPKVLETLSFNFVGSRVTNNKALATGGSVFYNRNRFIGGGMMNENFISYGPEDGEQDARFRKLGYRTHRVSLPLYHLDHIRTINSMEDHVHSRQNWAEIAKIRRLNAHELRQYISTWSWIK